MAKRSPKKNIRSIRASMGHILLIRSSIMRARLLTSPIDGFIIINYIHAKFMSFYSDNRLSHNNFFRFILIILLMR